MDRNTENAVLFLMTAGVALRKESVDRNIMVDDPDLALPASLSARRAWIEIVWKSLTRRGTPRRSPQGERG